MAKAFDYLVDDNFDLIIENGDFKKGDATLKHQHLLLLAEPGSFTQSPTIGVGIRSFLLDEADPDDMQKAIQREFEQDGMKISKMKINSLSDIQINAEYDV